MLCKTLGLALCALSLTAATASAQITDIDDIQVYDATGAPASPFNGQTVTIRGVITVEKGTFNSGTHYIQDATGGIQFFSSGFPAAALGDEFEVTGSVSSFGGELQLSSPAGTYLSSPGEVAPTVLTINQIIDNDGSGTTTAADYEVIGLLGQTTGTITGFTGGGLFQIYDGADTLDVFVDSDTGIDLSGVADGDLYQITAPIVNFSGLIEMKPRRQSDMIENPGNPAPLVSDITPTPWTPVASEAVNFAATITDNGSVSSATFYYRSGAVGPFTSVPMVNSVGDTWTAAVPGQPAGVLDYYLEATDDTAQTTTVPGSAPATARRMAIGTTSIVDIQSTLAAGSDASAYVDSVVNVEGIVTVAPGELQATTQSQYVIADPNGGPWSGVLIFEGSGANVFFRGDRIRVAAQIGEFGGITEVLPLRSDAIELIGFNEPLPPVDAFNSTLLDTTEAYESVIVQCFASTVADTVFGGENWSLQTTPGDSLLYVDRAPGVSYVATLGEHMRVTGYLDTQFGRNELVPRDDSDIFPIGTGVNDEIARARGAFFQSVYPNPFNPSTKMDYVVPRKGMVELVIFNARGERVRTLVSGEVAAGSYSMNWDGLDNAGEFVGSGVYYARLRLDAVSATVEKLTLIK